MPKKVNPFSVVLCLLLVVLASCSQVEDIGAGVDAGFDNDILGTATLTFTAGDEPSTVESQALVNGIGLSVLGRTVIDTNGERYMSLSLEVVNGSGQNLDNLNLIAIARDYTVAGTALTGVRDAAGNPITNPEVVRAVRPAHTVTLRNGQLQQVPEESDFQGYLPAEVAQVQTDADAVADDITVLEYGYVVRNTNGTRTIPAGESGIVSFTVRFPFDPDAPLGSPFRFSLTIALVNSPVTRFTRGWDETSQAFQDRVEAYYAPAPVPATTELLLVGEPNTPLTIGTTFTTPELQRFVDTPTTTLPTFEGELGRIKRVDQANRVLAAAFVDDDNRGSRLRIVPQANTQYFLQSQGVNEFSPVTADEFWEVAQQYSTVIVTGSQINDVVVEAQEMTLSSLYFYDNNVSITDIDVRSASEVLVNMTACFSFGRTLDEVDQGRVSDSFYIRSIAMREPFGPPTILFCTFSPFSVPLPIDELLESGEYTLTIGTGQFIEDVTFVIP
ncbi:MAG: hypothetical protein AAF708_22290 [Deinococcota bacterium]